MADQVKERTLEETSTWAVAVVCFVLLFISIVLEHSIHKIGTVSLFIFLLISRFPCFLLCFLLCFFNYCSVFLDLFSSSPTTINTTKSVRITKISDHSFFCALNSGLKRSTSRLFLKLLKRSKQVTIFFYLTWSIINKLLIFFYLTSSINKLLILFST